MELNQQSINGQLVYHQISQNNWSKQFNNCQLQKYPTDAQIHQIYIFINKLQTYHCPQLRKLLRYLGSPFKINEEILLVDTVDKLKEAVTQLVKDQYIVLQDYNEYLFSYKGFISYLLIANSNSCFIFDCLTLKNSISALVQILEHPNIIKLIYEPEITLHNIKRDFSIFMYNIFDLKCLEKYHRSELFVANTAKFQSPGYDDSQEESMSHYHKSSLKLAEYLLKNCKQLINRPLSDNRYLLNLFRNNFLGLLAYVKVIGKIPPLYKDYEQYLQSIISEYTKKSPEFHQILEPYDYYEQQKLLMDMNNWHRLPWVTEYLPVSHNSNKSPQGYKRQKLYQHLLDLRSHICRMMDWNQQSILSDRLLHIITEQLPNQSSLTNTNLNSDQSKICNLSVLHFEKVLREFYKQGVIAQQIEKHCPIEIWQLAKQIYYLIQLNEQRCEQEERMNNCQIFKITGSTVNNTPNKQINIKKLLTDIGWGNSSEWLNRKDDPSVKMYKQIVSIEEFDYSIAEEYVDKMKSNILTPKDISKYLKYAQYMRNRKYTELEKYYRQQLAEQQLKGNREKKVISQKNSQDEDYCEEADDVFQSDLENMISQKESLKLRSTKPTDLSLQSSQSLPIIPTSTSLQQNIRSRKTSQSSSLRLSQLDQVMINRKQIRPLPKNTQEIYQLAMEVKRKTAKKTNRKKQKKENKEIGKQVEFIPSENDIQAVLMANSQSY